MRFGVRIDGRPVPPDGRSDRAYLRRATPGYFKAMGIPLLAGQDIDASSGDSVSGPVAVISKLMADRMWPG